MRGQTIFYLNQIKKTRNIPISLPFFYLTIVSTRYINPLERKATNTPIKA